MISDARRAVNPLIREQKHCTGVKQVPFRSSLEQHLSLEIITLSARECYSVRSQNPFSINLKKTYTFDRIVHHPSSSPVHHHDQEHSTSKHQHEQDGGR
mmetsp:Transcript_10573/g.19380  ORF Transcript_10573/g.19380 Transcript_10573/m.19380 type:complete len:99 (+) Transcript_10573:295-591(+)